jgi:hypothetical protein
MKFEENIEMKRNVLFRMLGNICIFGVGENSDVLAPRGTAREKKPTNPFPIRLKLSNPNIPARTQMRL